MILIHFVFTDINGNLKHFEYHIKFGEADNESNCKDG